MNLDSISRPLTADEELLILKWCHNNPTADLQQKIQEWMQEFNCTKISILQVFVKESLGEITL